jgi:hypothetical protein
VPEVVPRIKLKPNRKGRKVRKGKAQILLPQFFFALFASVAVNVLL